MKKREKNKKQNKNRTISYFVFFFLKQKELFKRGNGILDLDIQ